MARFNSKTVYNFRAAAASAATDTQYKVVEQTFLFTDFQWMYETTEANADNTLDFVLDYTTDGTNFTALYTNANPMGLLNTGAPLVGFTDYADAASSGATGVAVTPTVARIPANAIIRCRLTTAGTGTIPAVQMNVIGQSV